MNGHTTYVIELTPRGRAAVAVVLVTGPGALVAVERSFIPASGRKIGDVPIGRIVVGHWGREHGEELVVCRRSADRVEVHCHGGVAAVRAVIATTNPGTTRILGRTPPQALQRAESVLGLSARDLAYILDTDPRSVDRWLTEDIIPQRKTRRGLADLAELSDLLADTFTDQEAAREWLETPSRALAGARPIDMIRGRRVDLARGALEALMSGVYI